MAKTNHSLYLQHLTILTIVLSMSKSIFSLIIEDKLVYFVAEKKVLKRFKAFLLIMMRTNTLAYIATVPPFITLTVL
jgi:hypothetical protein